MRKPPHERSGLMTGGGSKPSRAARLAPLRASLLLSPLLLLLAAAQGCGTRTPQGAGASRSLERGRAAAQSAGRHGDG
ncbi:MAG TPA: hypothetical protein VNZ44_11145, partial [Pyrinomonadaceae bacterium]|nr:hypothetical protein [Pyrinomonadaceae bacterium]